MSEKKGNQKSSLLAGILVGIIIVVILAGVIAFITAEDKKLVGTLFLFVLVLVALIGFIVIRGQKHKNTPTPLVKMFEKEFPDYKIDNINDPTINEQNQKIALDLVKYAPINWVYTYNHIKYRDFWEFMQTVYYVNNDIIFNGYYIKLPFDNNGVNMFISNGLINTALVPPNYKAVDTSDTDFDKVFTTYMEDDTKTIKDVINEKFMNELLDLQYDIGGCGFYFLNGEVIIFMQEQGLLKADAQDGESVLKIQTDLNFIQKVIKPFI